MTSLYVAISAMSIINQSWDGCCVLFSKGPRLVDQQSVCYLAIYSSKEVSLVCSLWFCV